MILQSSKLENHPDGVGDLNAILNGNWETLNRWINPAEGLTAAQTGTTVIASGPVFRSGDVGAVIRFADGTTRSIVSYTDADTVEVSPSGNVSAQEFELYRPGEPYRTVLVRGLVKQADLQGHSDGEVLRWDAANTRFRLEPEYKPDTSVVGPPTSGTYVVNQTFRDALGALWVCTSGGSPGTWVQVGEPVVAGTPSGTIPNGYRVIDSSDGYTRKIHTGGGVWAFIELKAGDDVPVEGKLLLKSGHDQSSDPGDGAVVLADANHELRYRTAATDEGAGALHRLHNRGGYEMSASATQPAIAGSYAEIGHDTPARADLPSGGTYLMIAQVRVVNMGGSAEGVFVKLYDATNSQDASQEYVHTAIPGEAVWIQVLALYTVPGAAQIQVHAYKTGASAVYAYEDGVRLAWIRLS